jgi:hypothetical protein
LDPGELLDRWREAGLLTTSQADAIRAYEARTGAPPAAPVAPEPESKPEAAPVAPVPSVAPVAPVAPPAVAAAPAPQRPPGPSGDARPLPSFGLGAQVPEIDLRTLGTVLAGLALLALLANMFAVTTDLFLGPGQQVATEAEDALHLVASVLGLVGGLRLASGRISGRALVYWSLGINLVATLLLSGAHLKEPLTIGTVLVWAVLAGVTWRARYRGRYRSF